MIRAAMFVAAALAVVVGPVTTPPNASAFTQDEIGCADAILEGAQDFVSDKLKAIVDCNDKGTSCNTGKRDRQIARATDRLTRTVERLCRRVVLENLGFPGTCPSSGDPFSSAELGSCLAAQLESFVDAAVALAYPSGIPDLSGKEDRCQNVIGGQTRVFISRKLRARTRCLDLQLKGTIAPEVDCLAAVPPGTGNRKTDQLVQKAIARLRDKLRRGCRDADLGAIGFPGGCADGTVMVRKGIVSAFSVSELESCLESSLELAADQIAGSLLPRTGPAPTPTPTEVVVETPTPSESPTSTETPTGEAPTTTETPTPTETTAGETPTPSPVETATETASPPGETPTPIETPTETPSVGPSPGPLCGNGMIDDGEDCDPAGGAATSCATVSNTSADFTCDVETCQCACPSFVDFVGTAGDVGVLDSGWTGQGHDSTVVDRGKVTVGITSCDGTSRPCGICDLLGPVDNLNAATYPSASGPSKDINNRRCTNNTGVVCTSSADCSQQCVGGGNDGAACTNGSECPGGSCPVAGTCEYYFGTYLPLAAGGVSTCVGNQINGAITGTANIETGASATSALLRSVVYSGPTLGEPCPRCVGDTAANDGARDGTCSSGDRSGLACDVNGSSPNPEWDSTSLDCPPLAGGAIAALAIDLSNTTGTKTRTLSASSPNCTASGFSAFKCQCDTCDTTAAEPCSSDADCPAGHVCGGKRCVGGPNNGAPCASPTECPTTFACNTVGAKTQPNNCDVTSECVSGDNTPATSATDMICSGGPVEQFCGPTETFRGCFSNTDCSFAGDICSVVRFRECFDTGTVGDTVTANGVEDAPVNDESNPTLAALFCIGPTTSGSVNGAAGLPGLGKLELPGHARGLP